MELKKSLLMGVVAASTTLGAVSANAALIGAWDWATDGGFESGATCDGGGTCSLNYSNSLADGITPATPSGTGLDSILSWGSGINGGPQSGLQLIFGTSLLGSVNAGSILGAGAINLDPFGPLLTDAGWTTISAGVHYNNVISVAGGSLGTVGVSTTFDIAPLGVPVGAVPPPPFATDFDVTLDETTNAASLALCPAPNPNGTLCDDIFTLTGSLPSQSFVQDGFVYTISFRSVAGEASVVFPTDDGFEIYTAETSPGVSVFFNEARIDARPVTVPAPSVLALMGFGLALVGWKRRRAA